MYSVKIMDNLSYETYREYLDLFLNKLKARMCENLLSVALFGSIARGEGRPESDIDLLILHNTTSDSFEDSYRLVMKEVRQSKAYKTLLNKNLHPFIAPVILRVEEITENPLILLDVIDHGVVLYDPKGVLKELSVKLKAKLKELGTKKIVLSKRRWIWQLKPDWKPGEVIEIKL